MILVLFSDTMKLYFHYFMKFTDVCSMMSVFCIILKNMNTVVQYLTTFIYLYSMSYFVHLVPKNIINIREKDFKINV